ncbi:MAG: chorismate lyase [Chromatiales bacterium]|nr:chorismate lyase [Chromatiales bacterium]
MSLEVLPLSKVEPTWVVCGRLRHSAVPDGLVDWLWDKGSLTAKLRRVCPGRFAVNLLHQGWGRSLYSEERLLGMRHGTRAIVREVELQCDGVPWVYARTLIPATSLRGGARRLAMLGTKPLGEVLFSDPNVVRDTMEIARLQPRHKLFTAAMASQTVIPGQIWGRRTLFHLAGAPLLVNEIFLPTLGQCAVEG